MVGGQQGLPVYGSRVVVAVDSTVPGTFVSLESCSFNVIFHDGNFLNFLRSGGKVHNGKIQIGGLLLSPDGKHPIDRDGRPIPYLDEQGKLIPFVDRLGRRVNEHFQLVDEQGRFVSGPATFSNEPVMGEHPDESVQFTTLCHLLKNAEQGDRFCAEHNLLVYFAKGQIRCPECDKVHAGEQGYIGLAPNQTRLQYKPQAKGRRAIDGSNKVLSNLVLGIRERYYDRSAPLTEWWKPPLMYVVFPGDAPPQISRTWLEAEVLKYGVTYRLPIEHVPCKARFERIAHNEAGVDAGFIEVVLKKLDTGVCFGVKLPEVAKAGVEKLVAERREAEGDEWIFNKDDLIVEEPLVEIKTWLDYAEFAESAPKHVIDFIRQHTISANTLRINGEQSYNSTMLKVIPDGSRVFVQNNVNTPNIQSVRRAPNKDSLIDCRGNVGFNFWYSQYRDQAPPAKREQNGVKQQDAKQHNHPRQAGKPAVVTTPGKAFPSVASSLPTDTSLSLTLSIADISGFKAPEALRVKAPVTTQAPAAATAPTPVTPPVTTQAPAAATAKVNPTPKSKILPIRNNQPVSLMPVGHVIADAIQKRFLAFGLSADNFVALRDKVGDATLRLLRQSWPTETMITPQGFIGQFVKAQVNIALDVDTMRELRGTGSVELLPTKEGTMHRVEEPLASVGTTQLDAGVVQAGMVDAPCSGSAVSSESLETEAAGVSPAAVTVG